MRWIKPVMLLLVLLVAWSLQAQPVAWDTPGERWHTRESAHFALHYPAALEPMTERVLAIAERVHAELWPAFATGGALNMSRRTQLVLVDDFDFSNGWATPLPFAQIRLFASAPEDMNGLEHMDDWMHGLIRHEYVHILHMELAAGAPKLGREVFGRQGWFFPHGLTPAIFTEGLAVYLESNEALGYGRLQSSYFAMQMRMETQDGQPDDMAQVVAPLRDWPLGKQYLYGAYFITFIAEQYGEDALQQYMTRYSEQLIPWFLQNHTARRVFGKSWPRLWREYQDWLLQRFGVITEALTVADPVPVRRLGPSFRQVTAASADSLWLVRNNREDRQQLVQMHWRNGAWHEQRHAGTKGVTDLDVAADGRLVLSRAINRASGRVFNEVFLWSPADGFQQLTHNGRFRKVRWLPDESVLASRQQHGHSELWQLDTHGGQVLLWRGEAGSVLGSFAVSPDGRWLVAAMKRPQQGWNLERFDRQEQAWQALTDSRATENSPEWTASGEILFSADYDGVFNVYRLHPDTGVLEQLTQVKGGAFEPRWLAGQLVYQEYSRDGYRLQVLTEPAAVAVTGLEHISGRYDYPPAVTQSVASQRTDYQPWPTLRPTWWMPLWIADDDRSQIGVATGGSDALGRHNYSLQALWDTGQQWGEGALMYVYDNRWTLMWQRTHSYRDHSASTDPLVLREDRWTLSRAHLLNAWEDQVQVQAGLVAETNRWVQLSPGVVGIGREKRLAGMALVLDNRERYLDVPGVGWGSYADILYESNDVLPGDYRGGQWQAQWQQTLDLPGRRTLSLALAGGRADSGAEPFLLGGLEGEEQFLFGRDEFSLPGYRAGSRIGHRYQRSELHLKGWLKRFEHNLGLSPLGFGDLSGGLYAVQGNAWFAGQQRKALTSVGAELQLEVVLGYHMLLPLRFGVVQGLDSEIGRQEVYARAGFNF